MEMWNRRNRRRRLGATVVGVAAVMGAGLESSPAHAVPPRTTYSSQDVKVCGFPVHVESSVNIDGSTTTRPDGSTVTHVYGNARAVLTQPLTGASIVETFPGSNDYTTNPDGSRVNHFNGGLFLYLYLGAADAAQLGLPRLAAIHGRVTVTFDPTGTRTSFSWTGSVRDLCAALS
jgi:hypothetical protein